MLSVIAILVVQTSMTFAVEPVCNGGFQGKTARLIVHHKVGGGYDSSARVFAAHYQRISGARVQVDNVPDGNGAVGARKIIDSDPDGLTFGLMNGPKRAVEHMLDEDMPDFLNDFVILGRIARNRHVIFVRGDSDISSFDHLVGNDSAAVWGTNHLRTTGFLTWTLIADLLNVNFNHVAGLGGTRKRVLAVSRGDVDLISVNFHSVVADVESGVLKPLLQRSDAPVSDHPALENVPLLGGKDGWAASRAADIGIDVEKAVRKVGYIDTLNSAGRLFVASSKLSVELQNCMQKGFYQTLTDPQFIAAMEQANLGLDAANGETARQELVGSVSELDEYLPFLKQRFVDN